MAKAFDLIVIETGAAATAANRCANAGWRMAVIDNLPYRGARSLPAASPRSTGAL